MTPLHKTLLDALADKNTVLLELGVGFNTPTIIRLPFENLLREPGHFAACHKE